VPIQLTGLSGNIRLLDMDSDGDLDLLALSSGHWYENLMLNGEWGEYQPQDAEEIEGGLLNGANVVYAGCEGGLMLIGRKGNPEQQYISLFDPILQRFSEFMLAADQMVLQLVRYADLNGDGTLDLVGSVNGWGDIAWFENITNLFSVEVLLPADTVGLNDPLLPLTGGNPEGGTYTFAGDTITEFDPLAAGLGTHQIVYTYADPFTGCIGSDTTTVVVELSTNISARHTSEPFTIFPNPADQEVSITFVPTGRDRLLIHDAVGRLVETHIVQRSPLRLQTVGYAAGTYTITLDQEGTRQFVVLVVE